MNKKRVMLFAVIFLSIVLMLSFASASMFSNFWSKLTGKAVEPVGCSNPCNGMVNGDCCDSDCKTICQRVAGLGLCCVANSNPSTNNPSSTSSSDSSSQISTITKTVTPTCPGDSCTYVGDCCDASCKTTCQRKLGVGLCCLPKESPSPNFPSENNSNIGNNTNKTPSASQPIVYPTCPNAMTPCDSAGTICSNGGVCKRLPASQGGGLCCEATPSPNKPSSESSSSNAVTSPKKITRLDSSSANNQNTQFQTTITQKTKIKFFAKLKSLFLGKSTVKAISSTTSTGNCENPCNGMNVGDCCT